MNNSKKIIYEYIEASYWHLPKEVIQNKLIGKSTQEQFITCIEYRGLETFIKYFKKHYKND